MKKLILIFIVGCVLSMPVIASTLDPTSLYLVSYGNASVDRYDPATRTKVEDAIPQGVISAGDAAFAPDGKLWVLSANGNYIKRYDGSGLVDQLDGGPMNPSFINFGPDGNAYVSYIYESALYKYDGTTGALMGKLIDTTTIGGNRAYGNDFGPDGNLYVSMFNSDWSAVEIHKYDPLSGAHLGKFADVPGTSPQGLAIGRGQLASVDYYGNAVYRFDAVTGDPIGTLSGITRPKNADYGADGTLYVVSDYGSFTIAEYDINDSRYNWNSPVGLQGVIAPAIPEPATMCLLGLGALGLMRRKR